MKIKQSNLKFGVPKSKILGKLFLVPIMFLFVVSLVFAAGETMTRTVPASADTSSTFTLTYTVIGDAPWGATIVDSVSGDCTFPGGATTYNGVMLSDDGDTREVTITTGSEGTCTFPSTGNYKFDIQDIAYFTSQEVTISAPAVDDGNGGGGGGGGGSATAPSIYCYVIENNVCYGEGLVTCFGLSSDEQYTTLSECEDNLIPEEEEKSYTWLIVLLILGGIGYYFYKNQ